MAILTGTVNALASHGLNNFISGQENANLIGIKQGGAMLVVEQAEEADSPAQRVLVFVPEENTPMMQFLGGYLDVCDLFRTEAEITPGMVNFVPPQSPYDVCTKTIFTNIAEGNNQPVFLTVGGSAEPRKLERPIEGCNHIFVADRNFKVTPS